MIVPVQPQVVFSAGVDVRVPAPVVRFEAEPALVVVSPGVMVVPDYHHEVFFANGFYWYHDRGVWFRTRNHRGGWVRVHGRYVPRAIVRYPRGRFVRYHGGKPYRRAAVYRGRGRPTVVRVNGNGKVKVVKRKRKHWH
ncbi:MAG TPA: hypothetical protein VFU21_18725 [Kofleriaceae bacterium]|nr:hypothetical protein [Kofleriaceae bacterium]